MGWINQRNGTWTPLTRVSRHAPDRPLVLLSADGVVTVCQDNHPVFVRPNTEDSQGAAKFLPPSELDVKGVFLDVDLRGGLGQGEITPPTDVHPYVVGMFLTKGCVNYQSVPKTNRRKKPYSITISQNDGPVKDQLLALLPLDWVSVEVTKKHVRVHGLAVDECFDQLFGRYSFGKALPADFLHYPATWLWQCLAGMLDGDGTKLRMNHGPDQLVLDTTSLELAQQVLFMGYRLGFKVSIVGATVRKLTRHQGYQVHISVNAAVREGLVLSVKMKSLESTSSAGIPSTPGPALLSTMKPVVYTNPFVYDVATASGAFTAGGVRTHNSAGATSMKKSVINSIGRVRQIVAMPEILPGSATLATESGVISKIEKDPAGGFRVWVGDTDHYVPFGVDLIKKRGDKVKKGEALSKGIVNPHELLPLAGVNAVQSYLTDELDNLYSKEGVRRVHDEVLVRAITNLGRVVDPGDHPDLLTSDITSVQAIEAWNAEHRGEKPVKYEAVLKGVDVLPLEQTEDWMARLAYRRPAETITRGVTEGWRSDLHGPHPIPGVVYGAEFGKPPSGSKTPY